MIIADEVHKLRNREAACTRRVERFMIANPETVFCGLSGTITKRSVRDYWHLLYWALRHNMPLPRTEAEMEKWAEVLDEKRVEAMGRRGPGVLMALCSEEERLEAFPKRAAPLGRTQQMPVFHFNNRLTAARKGYQRRLRDSPGVICSPDRNLDCSLIIRRIGVEPSVAIQAHFARLRGETTLNGEWMTPNGDILTQPVDVWRHARELACGFYYRWDPPPPNEWLRKRSAWNGYVRNILSWDGELHEQYKHLHLDSPMQVALAVKGSTHTDEATGNVTQRAPTIVNPLIQQSLQEWDEIKNTFKINTVAEWLDETTLLACLGWMKANKSGIVWTEHRAFGQRLAAMLQTGFCSTGGLDENGRPIEEYDGAPVVASVAANCEGRNLQAWNRNLIVTMSPTGYIGEQLLGRTHRMGQQADTVYVDWIAACDEQDRGFDQMIADARYIQDTTGQSQKLLYADRIS
jgi:hypothetical protein